MAEVSQHSASSARNVIDVACVADQRFYEGARVSLISLVSCASGRFDYRLHLFSNDMAAASVETIRNACATVASRKDIKVELVFHQLDEESISVLPLRRGSRMTYLRLMVPQLLADLDEITYIDTDTLFLAGIEGFQSNLQSNGMLLAGTPDFYQTLDNECHWLESLSASEKKSPYINAGICRMNLAAMREMKLLDLALALLADHPTPRYVDQSLLNYLCRGRIEVFDKKYNFVVDMRANQFLNRGDILKNYHYIGKAKPWHNTPGVKNWLATQYWHVAADLYSGGSGHVTGADPAKVFRTRLKLLFSAVFRPQDFPLHRENLRSLRDPARSIEAARLALIERFTASSNAHASSCP